MDGDASHPQVALWSQRLEAAIRAQPPGDLGVKMQAAVAACDTAGQPALIVGSDLPEIDLAYIEQAAALLVAHDLVLGPAEDGGYGLIGLKTPAPLLFSGIPWSTPAVLAQTRSRAAELGLRVGELPTTWDVDRLEDWKRFLALQAAARSAS